jgi:predicted dehydrogenase
MANIGFIGAGGIARAHAFSLNSLKYYYNDAVQVNFVSVTSFTEKSRTEFAENFGFSRAEEIATFAASKDIDTVFILGPNKVHFEHLNLALGMKQVKNVYLEKPVCSTLDEEKQMKALIKSHGSKVNIQVGFQFLLTAAVREALAFWKSSVLGKPIHFDLKYYHGDYLQKSYRDKRQTRLTPAPDGGAMADLGSHGISLLMAFFGEDLKIMNALQAGSFADVPNDSDLFSSLSLVDPQSGAAGTLSASRISSGTGDLVYLEIFAEEGALRFNSHYPGYFEYFLERTGQWTKQPVGSHYKPITSFPSGHVPAGWLRSMMHAHYLFMGGKDEKAFVPDLKHGLAVQRIVRETATHLKDFRQAVSKTE